MPAILEEGDLLTCKEQYIIHQCNCVSRGAGGLAYFLFKAFPYADIYSQRESYSVPGKIYICGDGVEKRFIINAMSQYYPGGTTANDTAELRIRLFEKVLQEVREIDGLKSIAFPWKYGCGIAGGDWEVYKKMIDKFADELPEVIVKIVKRPEDD